jgi:hypothetical protein
MLSLEETVHGMHAALKGKEKMFPLNERESCAVSISSKGEVAPHRGARPCSRRGSTDWVCQM